MRKKIKNVSEICDNNSSSCERSARRSSKEFHVRFVERKNMPSLSLLFSSQLKGCSEEIFDFSAGEGSIDSEHVINYYNNYTLFKHKSARAKDVVLCDFPEKVPEFWEVPKLADFCVVISKSYEKQIIDMGVSRNKIRLIRPGKTLYYDDLSNLRVFFPSCVKDMGIVELRDCNCLREMPWLDCTVNDGSFDEKWMRDEFLKTDVVVSTALLDGGPLFILDSLFYGKQIFVRKNVGFSDDISTIYTYDCLDDLISCLKILWDGKKEKIDSIGEFSWEIWKNAHFNMFSALFNNRNF